MNAPHKTQLKKRVKAVWRRERQLRFVEGALAFMLWGLALFLAAGFTDWMIGRWLTDVPAAGRCALLLLVLGVPLYRAWRAGWMYIRPFNATRAALRIEARQGGMESLLVTALQFGDTARRHGTSDALCDLTCRKAEESAVGIRPKDTVRFQSLRRPALRALIAALLFLLVAATNGPLVVAALGRIFAPWLAITYPTRTRLELAKTDLVVQEGRPVRIAARVLGVVPRKAKIALRTGKGRPRVRKLPIVDGECEYLIETAYRGFRYRLAAGDARSPWHTVEVVSTPNIEHAEVRLEFPEYTKRPPETVESLTMTVPETTRIRWSLSLDRAVREATVTFAGQDPAPLDISEDGRKVQFEQVATESRAYGFSWVEREHGFVFTSPNNYLQVAPDRPPRVELTSPDRNVYATLGRKLDLAFRGRDDHGIAESVVCYRVDKTEEEKVRFTPAKPIDGTEQTIDWDYRTVLTNLTVGQTVTFAVELADSYPGEKGPHRARSDARRVQFMSMEDYLAQVEKQRQRLLSRLRTLYREEREVHEVVMRLDRSDPVFLQSCQLEAVRQDMMRDRLNNLAGEMLHLTQDLAANGVTNQSVTASLVQLRADLLRISAQHVAEAANALRALASESNGPGGDSGAAKDHAAHMVNSSARELGLLVLHLGFEDAAEVMAREMHAAAQTQASLRLQTIVRGTRDSVTVPGEPGGDTARLAGAQERLGKWLSRLFAASPKGKESTIDDALIEFTLTRLVKRLINGGVDTRLQKAAGLIREGGSVEAAKLQSGVIAALLEAEFRLRVGAEREALARAEDLFVAQEDAQKKLRLEIEALDGKAFQDARAELSRLQSDLNKNLQLLLMPAVPAPRAKLLDDIPPVPPSVNDLLGAAEAAVMEAATQIEKGEAASKLQEKAETIFGELAAIVRKRIAAMTQAVRIGRLSYAGRETDEFLGRLSERQLSLLEKTQDAAADKTAAGYLAAQEEALADAVDELRMELTTRIQASVFPSEHSLSLPARLHEASEAIRKAVPLLAENKAAEAARLEESAITALSGARNLLAEHRQCIGPFAGMLAAAKTASMPGPYVREIEEEQRDMLALTRKTGPDEMPKLAIPQKNLIHAVDAILAALDPIEHMVDSGTVMLFAKEDMDAAGTALAAKDEAEAVDAQDYIVETLGELRGRIDAVTPLYFYVLEIVEALYDTVQEGIMIRESQRTLRENVAAEGVDLSALVEAQSALTARAEAYGKRINEITGLGIFVSSAAHMAEVEDRLKGGDPAAAAQAMAQAEEALKADTGTLLTLMKHLPLLFSAPPASGEPPAELVLAREVLAMAAQQKHVYRESCAADANKIPGYEAKLREFEKACGPFIDRAKQHKNPVVKRKEPPEPTPPANLHLKLVAAKGALGKAASSCKASERAKALASQKQAAESLRHFIIEYALKFVRPPGAMPGGPIPNPAFSEDEDMMQLFMPGAVSGKRPPDGRLEWEVLGKRDRAALNENFARELPLEYRAILKDYYERLAK
jgi:hypothetical protein